MIVWDYHKSGKWRCRKHYDINNGNNVLMLMRDANMQLVTNGDTTHLVGDDPEKVNRTMYVVFAEVPDKEPDMNKKLLLSAHDYEGQNDDTDRLQAIFDCLWHDFNMRPKGYVANDVAAATKFHLEDMRKIATQLLDHVAGAPQLPPLTSHHKDERPF